MSTTVELGRMRDQRDAALAELAALRETIAGAIEADIEPIRLDDDWLDSARRLGMQDAARIARAVR